MQTLGGMAHYDFTMTDAYSYEQAFGVLQKLELELTAREQLFRRMVLNILAFNCDDHVKNMAFLMDRRGTWTLAPAYDLTFQYKPSGTWTSRHQMSLNGKQEYFTDADFLSCEKLARLKQGWAKRTIREIRDVIRRWPEYAERAGVSVARRTKIQEILQS